MTKTASDNYEDMDLADLNAANDAIGQEIDKLRGERDKLNEVRNRKARMENLKPLLEGMGHDVENMSYEQMEEVAARGKAAREKRREKADTQHISAPAVEAAQTARR